MKVRLSPKQIGKRILKFRKLKGMSQLDVAKFLEVPRSSVAQIELGNRSVSVIELMKLAELHAFSIDKFLATEYEVVELQSMVEESASTMESIRVSTPKLKVEKFINILLYIFERCAGKPNVGETVFNKLLYFSDFNYYEIYEEHLTGSKYRKLPYGPVPEKLSGVISRMINDGLLQRIKTEYQGLPHTRFIPLAKANLRLMSAAEIDVIDNVIDRHADWSARMISDYSHNDKPWRATEEKEFIDYELVFYRRAPYSVRIYDEDE